MGNDMFLKGELFEIPKKSTIGEDLLFVINAMDEKEWIRPFCTTIKAEKERIYATDGKRLHIVSENKILPEGQYRLIGKNGSTYKLVKMIEEVSYPNIDHLMPKDKPKFTMSVSDSSEGEFFHMLFSFPEKTAMKRKYFEDAFPSRSYSYEVEWREKEKIIVFKSDKRMALIMPMTVGEL